MKHFRSVALAVATVLSGCSVGGMSLSPGTSTHASSPQQGSARPAAAVDLYVANSGGPNGPGSITVYGLEHAKLLQTIVSGIDHPSAIGFDAAANLIAVANTLPRKHGRPGSVALYIPGSKTPATVLEGTNDPVSLAFDSTGKIYVADLHGGIGIYEELTDTILMGMSPRITQAI